MEDIRHTYTIQWVGPLTYDEYKEYVKGTDTIASGYFNFYYFEARKDARCRWRRYVGIHKQNDGIEKRLNPKHEHFSEFLDCKDLRIWIGSFADTKNQKADRIKMVGKLGSSYIWSDKNRSFILVHHRKYGLRAVPRILFRGCLICIVVVVVLLCLSIILSVTIC